MAEVERDSTQDWVLPAEHRPATVFELEQRIDVALAVARASEAAALEIGAAARDSAEQARRAADLAERASASVAARGISLSPGSGVQPDTGLDELRHFTERADRVLVRLRAIERLPQRTG